mmetsp:Transcript_9464/g.13985  ORF Transcript_9464/g.13985 Transcript_9464/m.13985 type:complete len:253 (-) Transcript_9464:1032-1790(-)
MSACRCFIYSSYVVGTVGSVGSVGEAPLTWPTISGSCIDISTDEDSTGTEWDVVSIVSTPTTSSTKTGSSSIGSGGGDATASSVTETISSSIGSGSGGGVVSGFGGGDCLSVLRWRGFSLSGTVDGQFACISNSSSSFLVTDPVNKPKLIAAIDPSKISFLRNVGKTNGASESCDAAGGFAAICATFEMASVFGVFTTGGGTKTFEIAGGEAFLGFVSCVAAGGGFSVFASCLTVGVTSTVFVSCFATGVAF